ncbi:MAG TPA: HupE/UreJ family protein, partial [Vicinamibacterales bacterium]
HLGGILLSFVAVSYVAVPAFGHDLERTEVTLRFAADTTFELDIANDPDWLLLRLEPFAVEAGIPGRPSVTPALPLSATERDALLASFAPVVIDRVVLWVDGHEVRPTTAEFIAPRAKTQADDVPGSPKPEGEGGSPLGIYRLRGKMAANARSLRWFYGIVIDPYPLTVRRADGRELKETILGKAWSETLDLAGQFDRPSSREVIARYLPLGLRYVRTTGFGQILFVLGLLLMTLRLRDVALQLTVFAVAQTIGFALMNTGVLAATGRAVWPVIALSIGYVVTESLLTRELTRWRLAFIGVFGLFHGAQLAGTFAKFGTPPAQFVIASAGFAAVVLGAEGAAVVATLLSASALRHRRFLVPAS